MVEEKNQTQKIPTPLRLMSVMCGPFYQVDDLLLLLLLLLLLQLRVLFKKTLPTMRYPPTF